MTFSTRASSLRFASGFSVGRTVSVLVPCLVLGVTAFACGSDDATPTPVGGDASTRSDAGVVEADARAPAALALEPLTMARVVRNASLDVPIVIKRTGADADVTLAVDGLPAGVTAAALTIPAGSTKGTLKLSAAAQATLATRATAKVRATTAGVSTDTTVDVVIVDPPGTLDTTFDTDGKVLANFDANGNDIGAAIMRQANGSVVVAINNITTNKVYLARYEANGQPDPAFGTSYVGDGAITNPAAIKERKDGSFLLTYRTGTANNPAASKVVAFESNGKPITTFGTNGELKLDASVLGSNPSRTLLAVGPNGDIYGLATYTGDNHIFRITQGGQMDPTFGTNGKVSLGSFFEAYGWAMDAKGGFVLAGSTGAPTYDRVAVRLLPDGQYDTAFSGDGRLAIAGGSSENFDSPVFLSNGRIAFGSTVTETGQLSVLLPNGDPDNAFDTDGVASTQGTQPLRLTTYGDDLVIVGSTSPFLEAARVGRFSGTTGAPYPSFGVGGLLDIKVAAKSVGTALVVDDIGRVTIVGGRSDATNFDVTLFRVWL